MSNTAEVENLETLVEDHADYLYRFALSRLRQPGEAEDLVQETFLAAGRNLASFRGESSVRTWLTSILKNKIYDFFKKAGREDSYAEVEDVDASTYSFLANGRWNPESAPVNLGTDPASLFERKEFLEILEECLKRLPPRMARVFSLRELDRLRTPEICNLLNLTTSNVSVIVHRAKLQLQSCIGETWSR